MKKITQTLKELSDAGLSQMDISRCTGIPQPRLSRWSKGFVPTGAEDALRLTSLLKEIKKEPIKFKEILNKEEG